MKSTEDSSKSELGLVDETSVELNRVLYQRSSEKLSMPSIMLDLMPVLMEYESEIHPFSRAPKI